MYVCVCPCACVRVYVCAHCHWGSQGTDASSCVRVDVNEEAKLNALVARRRIILRRDKREILQGDKGDVLAWLANYRPSEQLANPEQGPRAADCANFPGVTQSFGNVWYV